MATNICSRIHPDEEDGDYFDQPTPEALSFEGSDVVVHGHFSWGSKQDYGTAEVFCGVVHAAHHR